MAKKKILIFHPALAPYRIDQFNYLNSIFDLHVVFLFANLWNHSFDQRKLLTKCEFSYSFLLKGPQYKGRVFRIGILNSIRKFGPEIIISYEYSFTTLYLIFLKKIGVLKQQLGSTVDDNIAICENVQSVFRKISRSFSLRGLDFIVVLSNEVGNYYRATFKLTKSSVIVSPILQNETILRSPEKELINIANQYIDDFNLLNKKVILFIGRLIQEKGLVPFLETSHLTLKSIPDFKFIIVGDGEERMQIQRTIIQLGLDDIVVLAGRNEGIPLHAWYLACTGFILPSIFEPFGAVVNEAQIFGLPVFCSSVAGSLDIVNKDFGTIFHPKEAYQENLKSFVKIKMDFVQRIDKLRPSVMDNNTDAQIEWRKLIHE